jgi:hypothetical protein
VVLLHLALNVHISVTAIPGTNHIKHVCGFRLEPFSGLEDEEDKQE